MIKIENIQTTGWESAIRGMRNPMNSWSKSDSRWFYTAPDGYTAIPNFNEVYCIGPNDRDLMLKLCSAGTDHRKFMRMIVVYADITAPLYWWKEYDTYKVGTVANSCSTMHKIAEKEFTMEDFSCEHLIDDAIYEHDGLDSEEACIFPVSILKYTIHALNVCRNKFLETKDKKYWWQMIQLLPSSYNQRRTVMLNYEVLANIYKSRKDHKLDEWRTFCSWCENLPLSELITGETK